jgi:hypothetical protein
VLVHRNRASSGSPRRGHPLCDQRLWGGPSIAWMGARAACFGEARRKTANGQSSGKALRAVVSLICAYSRCCRTTQVYARPRGV